MKRAIRLACPVVLVAAALLLVLGAAPGADTPRKTEIGSPAPDFELKDVYGKVFKLAEFRGKVVVLEWVNGDIEAVTPRLLQQAAAAGDSFALDQWALNGRYLGVGITNLLHTFNPQRIVIGGSVWLHAQEFMLTTLWETIRTRSQSPDYWRDLEIVSAELGDDVGLLGAIALAEDEMERMGG